jgi:hypothetical protein
MELGVTPPPNRRAMLLAVSLSFVVACVALVLRLNTLGTIPHGWDAQGYVYQSRVFATGQLTGATDEFEDFFWSPLVVAAEDRKFAIYPPGWPAILSVAEFLGIPVAAESILFMLFLLGVWALAWRLFDSRSAWLTLGAAACSPFTLFMAGSYLSHLPAAVALIGVNLSLLKAIDANSREKTTAWGFLAGTCAGFAFLCRPLTAVLGVCATVLLMVLISRRHKKPLFYACLAAIPSGMTVAALYLVWNKTTTGAFLTTGYHILETGIGGHRQPGEGSAFLVISNWAKNLPLYLKSLNNEVWRGFTPDWLWPSLGLAFRWKQVQARALMLALAFYLVGHATYYYFDLYFGPRFAFELMPWFLVLTGAGLSSLVMLLKRRTTKWLGIACLFVAVTNGGFVLAQSIPYFYSYYAANYAGQSQELVDEVQERNVVDAVVLVQDDWGNLYNNFFNQNAIDLSASQPLFVRVNAANAPRLQELLAKYPRKYFWILNAQFDALEGRNLYPDRFSLRNIELFQLEEQKP